MQNLIKRLLFLLPVLIALPSFCPAQLREVGTGVAGPVKAPHLSAELISDSGTIHPGGKTRVALALTLEPGWHVYEHCCGRTFLTSGLNVQLDTVWTLRRQCHSDCDELLSAMTWHLEAGHQKPHFHPIEKVRRVNSRAFEYGVFPLRSSILLKSTRLQNQYSRVRFPLGAPLESTSHNVAEHGRTTARCLVNSTGILIHR